MSHLNNPLLEGIPEFNHPREFLLPMRYSPLEGVDTSSLDFTGRQTILHSGDAPYAPLPSTLKIASTLNSMMRASYESRNPLNVANRRRLINMQVGLGRTAPVNSCFGYIIKGITGVGKTAALSRFRSLFHESIVHPKNQAAGWAQQIQIPILTISMPDEGSRGGFIQAVLSEIDQITGQDYSVGYYKKYRTVDRLSTQLPKLLHSYYVGLLIVEELQFRNLEKSSQSSVMQLLLLSIMNAGIPLVLVGNPLGFDWINKFSQDRRRLNHHAPEFLHPMEIQDRNYDAQWGQFFEQVYLYYVLDGKPEGEKARLSHVLRSLSGGLPDLAMSLWKSAQQMILFEDVLEKRVGEGTLKVAYLDEGFDAMRRIADGFTYRNALQFSGCNDIPIEYYEKKWGTFNGPHDMAISEDNSSIQVVEGRHSSNQSKRVCSENSKLKRSKTLENNKLAKCERLKETLTNDDLRVQGISNMHQDSFRKLVGKDPK